MPDTTNHPPLSLERFAEVSAYLIHFKGVDEAEVLARLGVPLEDLYASRSTWTDRLGRELGRTETSLALVMAKAYQRTKGRLEAERPDFASIRQWSSESTPPPPPPALEPASVTTAVSPDAPSTPLSLERPSFLRETPPPPAPAFVALRPLTPDAIAERAPEGRGSLELDDAETSAAGDLSSFAPALPGAWKSAAQPVSLEARDTHLDAALPFTRDAIATRAPEERGSLELDDAETSVAGDLSSFAPALPGAWGSAAQPASLEAHDTDVDTALPFTPDPMTEGAAEGRGSLELDDAETSVAGDLSSFAPALPGAWRSSGQPAPLEARSTHWDTALPFKNPGAHASVPSPSLGSALPPSALHAHVPLTLEQYASLCIDSELDPAGRAASSRRYGLTPEQHAHLDVQFRRLFAAQPAQLDAFQRACAIYRAWREQSARR